MKKSPLSVTAVVKLTSKFINQIHYLKLTVESGTLAIREDTLIL